MYIFWYMREQNRLEMFLHHLIQKSQGICTLLPLGMWPNVLVHSSDKSDVTVPNYGILKEDQMDNIIWGSSWQPPSIQLREYFLWAENWVF